MSDRPARGEPAFASISTLFFAWGFITASIDPLVPSVRAVFSLSYTEAMLTQFAFFLAYGLVSLPAAMIVARAGAARSVLLALAGMAGGCLLVPLATMGRRYEGVLLALFVIASGVTVLQVAANPLAAKAGPADRAHFRLTLAQAFNSLGTVIAPYLGAALLLSGGVFAGGAIGAGATSASLRKIDTAFVAIAVCIALLGWRIWRVRTRIDNISPPAPLDLAALAQGFRDRWTLLGAMAIFLYVGAEVSIGSMMINFLQGSSILGVTAAAAGRLLSLYWMGALAGRFAGSALMTRLPAQALLLVVALVAGLLCLVVIGATGAAPAVAALSIGLFNAIMFPTIFTLTLERSAAPQSATSGVLCMAIVGGAVLPIVTGRTADLFGLSHAFAVPMTAYFGIALFARLAARPRALKPAAVGASPL